MEQKYISASEHASDGLLEPLDVAPHHALRALRIAVADRLEQLAVLLDGVIEPGDPVEARNQIRSVSM